MCTCLWTGVLLQTYLSVIGCLSHTLCRWWFGIELDETKGKNDGAVNGVRYFTCPADRGIFAPPHRLIK